MKMFEKLLCLLVYTVAICTVEVHSDARSDYHDQVVSQLRDERATKTFFPNVRPVNVTINMFVRSINEINDKDMTFRAQITFRQQWTDPRLAFPEKYGLRYITLRDTSLIWTPDVFFSNSIDGHKHGVLSNNELVRIYPDGGVLYSARISLRLFCPMDLKYFPMDQQTCSIKFASYGYTTDDVVLLWKQESPIQVTKSLNLPRFVLESYTTDYCTSKTNTGEYSCLIAGLTFVREINSYLMKIYIPCMCLVIVSYLSLWAKNTNTRYFIALLTLLTAGLSIGFINQLIPEVSYTKAIDVWTGVCLTFMFATLILVVITENLPKQKEEVDDCLMDGKPSNRRCQVKMSRFLKMVRILYPCLFVSFVVLYLIVYGILA